MGQPSTLPIYFQEIDFDTIEPWTHARIAGMRAALLEEGRLQAVIYFLAPHPEDHAKVVEGLFPLWLFTESDQAKDGGHHVASALFQQMRAFACLTVMEAWVWWGQGKTTEEVQNTAERREALVFVRETMDGVNMFQSIFTRDAEGKIVLDELVNFREGGEGRFTQFLQSSREDRSLRPSN